MCPHCGAPQLLAASNANSREIGWAVVVAVAIALVSIAGLIEYVPGISRTASELISLFFGVALLSLIWMFVSADKRKTFILNGQVDLTLFWEQLRSTFGDGLMWSFIIAAGVIGSIIGASFMRASA